MRLIIFILYIRTKHGDWGCPTSDYYLKQVVDDYKGNLPKICENFISAEEDYN